MNNCTFIGRVTKDATYAEYPIASHGKTVNTPFANFDIAVNEGFGEKQKTTFIRVTLTRETAKSLHQYLVKGREVAVQGPITLKNYTGNDGAIHQYIAMPVVRSIKLIGQKPAEKAAAETDEIPEEALEAAAAEEEEIDSPF